MTNVLGLKLAAAKNKNLFKTSIDTTFKHFQFMIELLVDIQGGEK
jgi:hypothetical protein